VGQILLGGLGIHSFDSQLRKWLLRGLRSVPKRSLSRRPASFFLNFPSAVPLRLSTSLFALHPSSYQNAVTSYRPYYLHRSDELVDLLFTLPKCSSTYLTIVLSFIFNLLLIVLYLILLGPADPAIHSGRSMSYLLSTDIF
jgi:hypothetical protein